MASTASAAALLLPWQSIASSGVPPTNLRSRAPDALGNWRMWYLASADALRPPAPGAATQDEIDEVIRVQSAAGPEVTEAIAKWGTGSAPIAWSNLAIELFAEFWMGAGFPQSRPMAILHTAIHDAAIAAWGAQRAHARPGPAATDSSITPAGGVDAEQPSFPSTHAAVAGAASVVLAHLFTDAAKGRFDQLAAEASESRIAAGAAFRSDVDAGLDIGHAVAELCDLPAVPLCEPCHQAYGLLQTPLAPALNVNAVTELATFGAARETLDRFQATHGPAGAQALIEIFVGAHEVTARVARRSEDGLVFPGTEADVELAESARAQGRAALALWEHVALQPV